MRIARVFPRRTRATPDDKLAFTGPPPFWAEADEVHVSVTFTWDLPWAERLAKEWERVAPVKIGGPACGTRGEEFVPGRYLKPGYTITSRGCPNLCWFCEAWKRDGRTRELPIRDGWNVLDDNLLACSEEHVWQVCRMLGRQTRRVAFTGGLEAARLGDWHVELLAELRPRPALFFAYDSPRDDWRHLKWAVERLLAAGFTTASHRLRCYVLCGFDSDTIASAEERLQDTLRLGLTPMAMLWRDPNTGKAPDDWRKFQRRWARPAIIHAAGRGF